MRLLVHDRADSEYERLYFEYERLHVETSVRVKNRLQDLQRNATQRGILGRFSGGVREGGASALNVAAFCTPRGGGVQVGVPARWPPGSHGVYGSGLIL